jgi:hypothetical protein
MWGLFKRKIKITKKMKKNMLNFISCQENSGQKHSETPFHHRQIAIKKDNK